jgi:membrane-associated phospholipid phosphatase|tara:strand:- start:3286 stop:3864 length:579 start_codon:yes stop_codon:yes gene_type:complete
LINLAYLISQFFHPLVVEITTFTILNLTFAGIFVDYKILFISILPGISVLATAIYLKKIGTLSDYNGIIRQERLSLISFGVIYHGIGFLLLRYLDAAPIIQGLMFCYSLNTGFVWIITTKWKISIHLIGLGGPLAALWLNGAQYPIIMFTFIFLLCYSRLILKAHTPMQVIIGSLFSISFTYFQLKYLFLYL